MKARFFGLWLWLVMAAMIFQANRCHQQTAGTTGVFPLATGNVWIYVDTLWQEGRVIQVFFDTLTVTAQQSFEGRPTYLLSDGRELMWRNDTLFQIVQQRGGYRFATIYFVAREQPVVFNYAFGGDVVIQRTAERLSECIRYYGNEKAACYRISDACGGDMILQVGVGVVYWRAGRCFAEEGSVLTKTLVKSSIRR